MDCKIISRLFFLIIFLSSTQLNAVEFKGKFLQGHYIVGITDPTAEIIIVELIQLLLLKISLKLPTTPSKNLICSKIKVTESMTRRIVEFADHGHKQIRSKSRQALSDPSLD